MARLRAAKGGQIVGGKLFKGGQFITNEAIALQLQMDGKASFDAGPIIKAAEKAAYENIGHALASIRKTAMQSIQRSPNRKPSPVGTPVHTRFGLAKRSLGYERKDKWGGVVGFDFQKIGTAMEVHEHGGRRKKQTYRKRPVMYPALISNLPRFAASWQSRVVGPGT
jgi:hypothetical protein